ncbi:class I SAM-dependent methyltransferase [Candidatus Woesearchaeota archaeon]|nr:class I SAM-dependent methyltransferase [Candidatus Woesearchaeota archaeon]
MHSQKLYQKYSDGRHWEKHPDLYAKIFAEFLNSVNFDGMIVDVGCGTGRDVNVFSKLGFNVLGIDYSKQEIESCKKRFPELNFEVQDAEKLKFKDNSVDALFMINVIHYVHKEKAIPEILRVLKHRGYFFIHFNIEIVDKTGKVDYHHNLGEIVKLVSKFKIIQQKLFERVDYQPIEHKIIELILQKP